jgi:hypothetical protein
MTPDLWFTFRFEDDRLLSRFIWKKFRLVVESGCSRSIPIPVPGSTCLPRRRRWLRERKKCIKLALARQFIDRGMTQFAKEGIFGH